MKASGGGEEIPGDLRRRLGLWLKTQRERAGLTQRELADLVGLEPGNGISAIENGRANVQPERYDVYCAALGMTQDDFAQVVLRHTDPWLYKVIFKSREKKLLEELARMQRGSPIQEPKSDGTERP